MPAEKPEDVLLNPEPWLPEGMRVADLCGPLETTISLASGDRLIEAWDEAVELLLYRLQREALERGADAVLDMQLVADPFNERGLVLTLIGTAARLSPRE